MASSEEYSKIFTSILKLYAPPSDPDLNHLEASLISVSGDNHLDFSLNEIKYKCLQCLKIIWNYLVKKKPNDIYS